MSKEPVKRNPWVVAAMALGVPITVVLRAFALSVVWGWIVVPLGVPEIGMAHAFGLAIVAEMLVPRTLGPGDKERLAAMTDRDMLIEVFSKALGLPLFALLFGASAHWMML